MSIVILVGGNSSQGNAEHRYLVGEFLQRFEDRVTHVITTHPTKRALATRLKRLAKRGHYRERLKRAMYKDDYGPCAETVQRLLLPNESDPVMPGGSRVSIVESHNSRACQSLIAANSPKVLVVYGTAIIREHISRLSSGVTLNMHTGLSPYYRGDSTLFWPVHDNQPSKLGVTVHQLVQSVDGGDIASTATITYEPGDTEAHLFAKAVKSGTNLYLDAVEQALSGTLHCRPQDLSIGREFSWMHRTVAAEKTVRARLTQWEQL